MYIHARPHHRVAFSFTDGNQGCAIKKRLRGGLEAQAAPLLFFRHREGLKNVAERLYGIETDERLPETDRRIGQGAGCVTKESRSDFAVPGSTWRWIESGGSMPGKTSGSVFAS